VQVERGVDLGPGGVVFADAVDSHACAAVVAEALPWRLQLEAAALGHRVEASSCGLASSIVSGLGVELTWRTSTTWPKPWMRDGPGHGPAVVGSERTRWDTSKQKTPVESTIWGSKWDHPGRRMTS